MIESQPTKLPKKRFLLPILFLILGVILAGVVLPFLLKRKPKTPCGPQLPCPESTYYGGDILQKGEALKEVLQRWCLPLAKVTSIYDALKAVKFPFNKMKPGDSVSFYYQGLTFTGLEYHRDLVVSYAVRFDSNGTAQAAKLVKAVDTTRVAIRGTIEGSLWNSLLKIGGTPELVIEFAEILRYDIDFFTECNNGDTFELLVDKLSVEGKFYRYGMVYAVHYRSRSENVYGFYFRDPSGHWDYYNEKGQSLRKTLLRSPLSYARVSSFFGRRFHPILRVFRPHHGVDYVAPKGTPVSAIADGVITMARWYGGYGNMVEIKHSSGLVSRYGHLSGYGPGIKVGRRIHQGATVGYVGATGLATGPHLHFEIRQNGKPVNPLKVIPPRAEPVAKKYKEIFEAAKNRYLEELKEITPVLDYQPVSISK